MKPTRIGWSLLLTVFLLDGARILGAQNQATPPEPELLTEPELLIKIIDGEKAINNQRKRINREPIVEVQDQNHRPIGGATVAFLLPDSGPGGTFSGGSQILIVITDTTGRAVATGFTPNGTAGKFVINVNASFQGKAAAIAIHQTNLASAATAGGAGAGAGVAAAGLSVGTIAAIAGGAAAAGAIVAAKELTGGGTGGSTSSSLATISSPGSPVFGPAFRIGLPFTYRQSSLTAVPGSASTEAANSFLKSRVRRVECWFCLTGAEAKTANAVHATTVLRAIGLGKALPLERSRSVSSLISRVAASRVIRMTGTHVSIGQRSGRDGFQNLSTGFGGKPPGRGRFHN